MARSPMNPIAAMVVIRKGGKNVYAQGPDEIVIELRQDPSSP